LLFMVRYDLPLVDYSPLFSLNYPVRILGLAHSLLFSLLLLLTDVYLPEKGGGLVWGFSFSFSFGAVVVLLYSFFFPGKLIYMWCLSV